MNGIVSSAARRRNMLNVVLLVVLGGSVVKGFADLVQVLSLEAKGAVSGDALIYLTVGRGILNGLVPYVDLFESKPPGMFLLMAASLALSGTQMPATVLQVGVFGLLPVVLAGFGYCQGSRQTSRAARWRVAGLAFVIGVMLTLFLESVGAGSLQTESFGGFFGALYVVVLLWNRERISRAQIAVCAVLLMFSIGLKEPFLLTNLAAALIATSGRKQFLRGFVLPLGIGALLGLTILLVLGQLDAYWNVYLPAMLEHRIFMNAEDPLWLRGFRVRRTLAGLTTYSAVPLLGYVLACLWATVPMLKAGILRKGERFLTVLSMAVWAGVLHFGYVVLKVLYILWRLGVDRVENAWFLVGLVAGLATACGGAGVLSYALWRKNRPAAWYVATAVAALWLLTLAGASGSFFPIHSGFALPAYVAASLVFVRGIARGQRHSILLPIVVVLVGAGIATFKIPGEQLELAERDLQNTFAANREQAKQLDDLMNSCDINRFGYVAGFPRVAAYAKHSPVGPVFSLFFHEYLGEDHPLFEQTRKNLRQAQLVVVASEKMGAEHAASDVVAEQFDESVPECARAYVPIRGLKLLFRKAG